MCNVIMCFPEIASSSAPFLRSGLWTSSALLQLHTADAGLVFMGVDNTTDTTDSVRTSSVTFTERPMGKPLSKADLSVQVCSPWRRHWWSLVADLTRDTESCTFEPAPALGRIPPSPWFHPRIPRYDLQTRVLSQFSSTV